MTVRDDVRNVEELLLQSNDKVVTLSRSVALRIVAAAKQNIEVKESNVNNSVKGKLKQKDSEYDLLLEKLKKKEAEYNALVRKVRNLAAAYGGSHE